MAAADAQASKVSGQARTSVLSTPVQLGCVLFLSLAIFGASILYGYHDAHNCAIDYPHDGQCGLEAMKDWSFGLLLGMAILIAGGLFVIFRNARRKTEAEDETPPNGTHLPL